MNEPPLSHPSGPLEPGLNPSYTFSSFLEDKSNLLAHAAAMAVAEGPGQFYNPLLLYGGAGQGKTHLLHAIGNHALEGGLAVRYVSAETFADDATRAIRTHAVEEFRASYGAVDVLLVDDMQFIAGKEAVEEEFFQIFTHLYEAKKQIVLSSDRPPKSIPHLEERLRSCFEWGLLADLQPPDLEMRVAFLRAKAMSMQREVPDEVILFVARLIHRNTHKLEDSLNRVLAYAEEHDVPLTVEAARRALQDELNERYGFE